MTARVIVNFGSLQCADVPTSFLRLIELSADSERTGACIKIMVG